MDERERTNPIKTSMARQGCQHLTYLGDGVYAGTDGHQIWLMTERLTEDVHRIALEPHVMKALRQYEDSLKT